MIWLKPIENTAATTVRFYVFILNKDTQYLGVGKQILVFKTQVFTLLHSFKSV